MHRTVAYSFSEILILTEKVSRLSKTFIRNFFCYDKSLQLRPCYFQNSDTQAGLQVKLFIVGTLKKKKNASSNFSTKAQYQISCSSFESLRVDMGVEAKTGQVEDTRRNLLRPVANSQ